MRCPMLSIPMDPKVVENLVSSRQTTMEPRELGRLETQRTRTCTVRVPKLTRGTGTEVRRKA